MPWHVSKSSDCPSSRPWAVIKDSDGSVVACHKTESDAMQQMKALYANENGYPLLSLIQVMTLMQCSKASIYRWIQEGNFPEPIKKYGSPRWKSSDLQAYLPKKLAGLT